MKILKDFLTCKDVLAANHHYPEKIQKLFRLQNCLRRQSSLSWKFSTFFLPAKLSLTQIIIILKLFKNFSPAKLSHPQIIIILKILKEFFACEMALADSRQLSLSWKYSKTLSPAILSWTQIIFILKLFKHFFACKNVLDAKHHYPEIVQRFFRLQNCLNRKSFLS